MNYVKELLKEKRIEIICYFQHNHWFMLKYPELLYFPITDGDKLWEEGYRPQVKDIKIDYSKISNYKFYIETSKEDNEDIKKYKEILEDFDKLINC